MSDNIIEFKFDKLDYQEDAINSVVDLFKGLPRKTDEIYKNTNLRKILDFDPIRNPKIIEGEKLLNNLNEVQARNDLLIDDEFVGNNNFTVEMETGTGKTYVYLSTILKLYKEYDFKKFIIIVPSVAIREGVSKSIQQLNKHFFGLYSIDLLKHTLVCNSNNLKYLRTNLVESRELSIAILNKDLINKDINKINQEDELGNILLNDIAVIRPIVIIDEPQVMEGEKNKKSNTLQTIEKLNPLATLRYSATHKNLYNQVYKLDSYDAFKKDLVKKIAVKTINSQIRKDFPYINFIGFSKDLKAKIELFHQQQGGNIKFKKFEVKNGDSLEELSNLPQYHNMFIAETPNKNKPLKINMPNDEILELNIGEAKKEFVEDKKDIEIQIELAIRNHFDTQFKLIESGNKVKALTLFFIDEVKKIRGENGKDGEYLIIFDRIYNKIINNKDYKEKIEKYKDYFPNYQNVKLLREGYFAIDANNKKVYKDDASKEDRERAMNLILKGKDKLISFEEPLSFIFSHSALREGWDNPNVFTLCTLKKGSSDIAKKQEIGRGLRLPVDIYGNRINSNLNILTIIANESYEVFAEALQKDYNEEMDVNSEKVTNNVLKQTLELAKVPKEKIKSSLVKILKNELLENKVISKGKELLTKDFHKKLAKINFLDETLNSYSEQIKDNFIKVMNENGSKKTKKIEILNADEEYDNKVLSFIFESEYKEIYKNLLDALTKRSTYICDFDNEKFINRCIDEVNSFLNNKANTINYTLSEGKQMYKENKQFLLNKTNEKLLEDEILEEIEKTDFEIVNYIMYHTMLPRLALFKILSKIENRKSLNNQDILENVTKLILDIFNITKAENIVKYEIIDGYKLNENKIFEKDIITKKDIDEGIVFEAKEDSRALNKFYKLDSAGEKEFAESLESNHNIILFTKLKKGGFIIDTPYGNYSPDWAVVYKKENSEIKFYFIVETKFDKKEIELQEIEKTKIKCAKLHFNNINNIDKFDWVNSYQNFENKFNVKNRL